MITISIVFLVLAALVADAMSKSALRAQRQVQHLPTHDILVHHVPQLERQASEEQRLVLCTRARINAYIGFSGRRWFQRGFAGAQNGSVGRGGPERERDARLGF